jgi:Cu+-exporting ATPase
MRQGASLAIWYLHISAGPVETGMSVHSHDNGASHMPDDAAQASSSGPTATDPVCGMNVRLTPQARTEIFGGDDFYFCSEKCQTKFQADPWFYASGN